MRLTLKDGATAYALAEKISRTQIIYGGGGGNNGGGSSGGQDGGDINLAAPFTQGLGVVRLSQVRLNNSGIFTPGQGTILAESVEGYLSLFNRDDEIRVLEKGEEVCTVLADTQIGTVPRFLLQFVDESAYEAWTGYTFNNAPFHSQWRMLDNGTTLYLNTAVRVMGELKDCYMVDYNNELGFIPMDEISKTQISYGGGGNSSGGGGDWTDPVL